MNYFQEEIVNEGKGQSYGGDLYELNNRFLTRLRIQTPTLYDLNKDRNRYHFDYALVEYIDGRKAEDYFHHCNSQVQDKVFRRLGDMLTSMHANERNSYGELNQSGVNAGNCHLLQMENVKRELSYASQYIDSIRVNQSKLLDVLNKLESRIEPRRRYGFIHGELGPDHVLVDANLEPYLIDIEGASFFDIELEHSFLEFRFGDFYRYLKNEMLDSNRMLFYRFYHHMEACGCFIEDTQINNLQKISPIIIPAVLCYLLKIESRIDAVGVRAMNSNDLYYIGIKRGRFPKMFSHSDSQKDTIVRADSLLVEMAREGNQEAFGELVARYRVRAFGWATSLTRDGHLAEDIVQEALIRAL